MATYIALSRFTDQGIRSVKDTAKRAAAVQQAATTMGVEMKQIYWTLGHYDLVIVVEAADEQAATAFMLSVASTGNVRMETMRAFDRDEIIAILGKVS